MCGKVSLVESGFVLIVREVELGKKCVAVCLALRILDRVDELPYNFVDTGPIMQLCTKLTDTHFLHN